MNVQWSVVVKRKLLKQLDQLPKAVRASIVALIKEIECYGPIRGNWPNYGQLSNSRHHCHLKKGQPTYVAIWKVKDKPLKLVEFIYAGTHEKAPY